MKKKVDKKTNEKQPDVVFIDGIVMAQDKIEHQAKVFYVDDKDMELID